MVAWKVREIAVARGVTTAKELAQRAGINKNTASGLWRGNSSRADLTTIAKICAVLQCQPGDIMVVLEENHRTESLLYVAP